MLTLESIDILSPDIYVSGIPYDRYALLRREAPVFWHPEPTGRGFWAIMRHADVVRVSRDAAAFCSGRGIFIDDSAPGSPHVMNRMDAPRHTRFRGLVSNGFVPRVIQRM